MNRSTLGTIIAVAVAALVVGFIWYVATQQTPVVQPDTTAPPTTSENDTTEGETSDTNTSDQPVITFTDSGFTPSTLTIKAGDMITIKNESQSSVQFSSDDHPTHREHPEINMQVLQSGGETQLTITEPGTYTYHDHLNDRYTGTIIVTN